MTVLTSPIEQSHATAVDARPAAQVFVKAAARQARVSLLADTDGRRLDMRGTIVRKTDKGVDIRLDDLPGDGARFDGVAIHGHVQVEGIRYAFETFADGAVTGAGERVLRLRTPMRLTACERRRSTRQRFRQTAAVRLDCPDARGGMALDGMMLNLSSEGMACRLDGANAARLSPNERVRVSFAVGRDDERFQLDARVVTNTEGGTPGYRVVGLEFLNDIRFRRHHRRLRDALEEAV